MYLSGVGSTQIAQAHFLPHKKHLTLTDKVSYFNRSVAHDKVAIKRFSKPHVKNRKHKGQQTKYVYEHLRFHKQALRWHKKQLQRFETKLYRSQHTYTHTYTTKHVQASTYYGGGTISAIYAAFGSYAAQAVNVARCESSLSVYAVNGQYYGLFQMGSHERAVYGNSSTAYGQSVAAYHYFADTGYNWSPWQCKP